MLFSVIIPVYNVEKYIEYCINSMLCQIDKDVEIILIDDGSKDSSGIICDNYAMNYPQVKTFHKNNGGVSSARNMGLAKARGEYILWVDPDDYVTDDWYHTIKSKILDGYEAIYFIHRLIYEDGSTELQSYGGDSRNISLEETMESLAQDKIMSHLFDKVFKREVYKGLEFPSGVHFMEDYSIMHKLFYRAKNVYFIDKCLYNYRVNANGLCHSVNLDRLFSCVLIADSRYKWISEKGFIVNPSIRWCLSMCSECCRTKDNNSLEYYSAGQEIINKYFIKIITNSCYTMDLKIKSILIKIGLFRFAVYLSDFTKLTKMND